MTTDTKIAVTVLAACLVVSAAIVPSYIIGARERAREASTEARAWDVIAILEGDHGFRVLQSAWPEAPYDMVRIADELQLDYRLLPIIARAEGGVSSRTMVAARNPFGLSRHNEELMIFDSFEQATRKAGRTVLRLNGRGPVNIKRLAGRWCSDSLTWAANVTSILDKANRRASGWQRKRE